MRAQAATPGLSEAEGGVSTPGPRTAQRAAWIGLLLLIVLALAGALGDGPLSHASLAAPGGVRVDYERVVRRLAPSPIRVRVAAGPVPRERLQLDVMRRPRSELLAIFPQPLRERATARGSRFELATRGEGPFEIELRGEPRAIGPREIELAVDGGKPIRIRQLVLP
jgi:hypothetical protein